jgi:tetratricopeptide (TPR) repeat protein
MASKRLALLIATSQYIDPTLKQLNAPAQDAKGLAEVLGNPNIGNFEVRTLSDESTQKLKEEIEDFFGEDRSKDDLLLLYLSCHGIRGQDGHLYYATSDTRRKRLKSTSIEASFVNNLMSSCRASTQILLLDCCHSGAFAKGFTFKSEDSKDIHTNQYFEVNNSSKGKLVITASDAIQYALEGDDTIKKTEDSIIYSVFTEALVHGLESGEADLDVNGVVTYDELYDYVSNQVKQKTPQQTQRKWGFDSQGQIIIAKNPTFQKKIRVVEQEKEGRDKVDSKLLLELLQNEKVEEFNSIRKQDDIQLRFHKTDLSGKNLRGIDLHQTDLTESNLSNTTLIYANLQGAKLETANLAQADLRSSRLYGANLAHANLSKADLRGADLKGMIDFTGADLTGANMKAVDLDGMVNFAGAILHDVDFTGSTTDKVLINFNGADILNVKGIQIPVTPRGRQGQEQTTNEFVESLKSFSEAIAQEFKTYNIPAEGLKPIEESVKELGKEVGDMKDRKDLTSIERLNLRTKVVVVVEKIIRTLPTKSVDVDVFGSLEPFDKVIGESIRQLALNIQQELNTSIPTVSTKMLTATIASTNTYSIPDELTRVYADMEIEEVNISTDKISFKVGFSGRTDTTPYEIGSRIEEYLITNEGIQVTNISVSDGINVKDIQIPVTPRGRQGREQTTKQQYDLEIHPKTASALNNKGLALHNLGRYNEAIEYYDKALEIDSKNAVVLNNKGLALGNLGRYNEAIECYDKALEIDPKYVNALNNKGFALGNLGRYNEAIECYDKALKIDPKYVNALNNKGLALHNLGRYNEAIEYYDKALEIDSKNAVVLNNKGLALRNLGRYNEAIEYYDKALEIDPKYVNALNNKGSALHNLGRYNEAIEYYDKALEIDPKHVLAKKNRDISLKRMGKQPYKSGTNIEKNIKWYTSDGKPVYE